MGFKPDRLRGLREIKGLSQEKLAEIASLSQSVIPKVEKGRSVPSGDVLEKLACALDCTMDYLYGRGDEYGDCTTAAAYMGFEVFARDPDVTEEQRDRCRRALKHPDAPKTANAWRSLAQMIDLATEPASLGPGSLTVVKQRPKRAKAIGDLRPSSNLAHHHSGQ
jgi:transcriptional regulator with XRE-family HTH domain